MTDAARVILVANQKGGVGKSTTVATVAEMIATAGKRGRRVLVVDGDPQANVTVEDLGVDGDRGQSLAATLQFGAPLVPVRDVRTHLDVIAGGPQLAVVGAAAHLMAENGIDMAANLQTQLAALCDTEGYDVVLIDSGPGDVPLLDTYLSVANYLLIPDSRRPGQPRRRRTVGPPVLACPQVRGIHSAVGCAAVRRQSARGQAQ